MAIKDVLIEIEETLWQRAKVEAALRNIPLKELVALAIQNELKKAE
jgi:hypothetical protein